MDKLDLHFVSGILGNKVKIPKMCRSVPSSGQIMQH